MQNYDRGVARMKEGPIDGDIYMAAMVFPSSNGQTWDELQFQAEGLAKEFKSMIMLEIEETVRCNKSCDYFAIPAPVYDYHKMALVIGWYRQTGSSVGLQGEVIFCFNGIPSHQHFSGTNMDIKFDNRGGLPFNSSNDFGFKVAYGWTDNGGSSQVYAIK